MLGSSVVLLLQTSCRLNTIENMYVHQTHSKYLNNETEQLNQEFSKHEHSEPFGSHIKTLWVLEGCHPRQGQPNANLFSHIEPSSTFVFLLILVNLRTTWEEMQRTANHHHLFLSPKISGWCRSQLSAGSHPWAPQSQAPPPSPTLPPASSRAWSFPKAQEPEGLGICQEHRALPEEKPGFVYQLRSLVALTT